METRQIATLDELSVVVEEVLSLCIQNNINLITLKGELGAGKTAFTKTLASILHIASEITSPTFVVMKSYEIPSHEYFKTLVHIDAYRIESEDEMRVIGFDSLLNKKSNLVCIEWPERIVGLLKTAACNVEIVLHEDKTRTLTYEIKN